MKNHPSLLARTLLTVLVLILSARQVRAYSVVIDPTGAVSVYRGNVLGTQRDSGAPSGEVRRTEESRVSQDKPQELRRENTEEQRKVYPANKEMKIELRGGNEGTKVEFKQRIREENKGQSKKENFAGKLELPLQQPQPFQSAGGEQLNVENMKPQERFEQQDQHFKTVDTTQGEDVRIKIQDKYEVKSSNGTFEIRNGDVKVETTQPVSIDAKTGALSITTPTGEIRTVTTLPAQAMQRVIDSGMMQPPGSTSEEKVRLEQKGDGFVYKVEGEQQKKFFGFVPIKIKQEVEVSPETGEVEGVKRSFGNTLLDFFSL